MDQQTMPRSGGSHAPKGVRTKGHIIDRALELASSEGLNGITIGHLAEHVGMSKGGLFAHFRSKEELQQQVLRQAVERFQQAVVEPTLGAPPGRLRLQELVDRWIAWDGDEEHLPGGCPFVAFAAELDTQPGTARDFLADAQARWMAFLARLGEEAAAAGHLHANADPEMLAFQLHGILLSYHQMHHLLSDGRAGHKAKAALASLLAVHDAPGPTESPR